MFNITRFLIQNRKGVKKMKKTTILSLVALLVIISATSAMAAGVAKTASTTVSAVVAAGTNDLTVAPGTWTWGTLPAANITTYRFSSGSYVGSPGPLSVTYFPAAPYEIRVCTDHDITTGDTRGFLTSGANKAYLKAWCINYGAPAASVATGPNPMNDYFWNGLDLSVPADGDKVDTVPDGETRAESTYGDLNGDGDTLDTITSTGPEGAYVSNTQYALGEEPAWLWILEKDAMAEGFVGDDEYTRRRLSWNYPTDAELPSGYKVHVAMDLRSVPAGTYGGTLIFELYTY